MPCPHGSKDHCLSKARNLGVKGTLARLPPSGLFARADPFSPPAPAADVA